MGAFADVLGGAASGFAQAAQQDRQRQFLDEENRRKQISDYLTSIAGNENAHPYARTAAGQMLLEIHQTPWTKPIKPDFNRLITPIDQQQPESTFTPPPQAPMQLGNVSIPPPPSQTVGLAAQSPGIYMSPGQVTSNLAQRVGQTTGAQEAATMKTPIYTRNAQGGFDVVPLSGGGQQMGPGVENVVPPFMMQGRGLRQIKYIDPNTGQVAIGSQNLMTHELYDQQGQVLPPGVQPFESSLVPTVHNNLEKVQQASGDINLVPVTTTTQKVLPPGKGAQPAQGGSAIPPPPGPAPQGAAAPRAQGQGQAPRARVRGAGTTVGHMPPSPAQQEKMQQQAQMRDSAIDLIDDIMHHKQLFDSLLSSGKVAIASNPDGSGIISRAAGLSDEEARVAGDFSQLIEHANLLRGPLGASGFRGREAWGALQAQRGRPMADPRITMQVLTGMRSRLVGLGKADQLVMQGKGTDQTALQPRVGGHGVGDTVMIKGVPHKITKIYDDGRFDTDQGGKK